MFKKNHKPRPSAAIEEFNSSSDTVSLRAKLENERMSRRQALRKMGVMSGVAVLSLLTVDDLARLAAKQLDSSGGDSELASSVAKSLRSAGVAFAAGNPFHGDEQYWSDTCRDGCNYFMAFAWEDPLEKVKGSNFVKSKRDFCSKTPNPSNCFIDAAAGAITEAALNALSQSDKDAVEGAMQDIAAFKKCCAQQCTAGYDGTDEDNPCSKDFFLGKPVSPPGTRPV